SHLVSFVFSLISCPPPSSTLFPYTTLFRSDLGYLTVYAGAKLAQNEISTGAARIGAGRLGPLEIRNSEIVLGVPLRITKSNIDRSEEHTSELQSRFDLVCRLLLEKKKQYITLDGARHVMPGLSPAEQLHPLVLDAPAPHPVAVQLAPRARHAAQHLLVLDADRGPE